MRPVTYPPNAGSGKIDYTTAKAVPTICFGCTTHCGVVGWIQDGVVSTEERWELTHSYTDAAVHASQLLEQDYALKAHQRL